VILLDTNVLSEAWRPRPSAIVRTWLDAQTQDNLLLCTPVLAELRYGIERLGSGKRRRWLEEAVNQAEKEFSDRILPVDRNAAHEFGRVVARRDRSGRPIGTMDALIAAIAICHRATLVTRNLTDFAGLDLALVDPFAPVVS
jgi:predicted nucleic acid-binding protein